MGAQGCSRLPMEVKMAGLSAAAAPGVALPLLLTLGGVPELPTAGSFCRRRPLLVQLHCTPHNVARATGAAGAGVSGGGCRGWGQAGLLLAIPGPRAW